MDLRADLVNLTSPSQAKIALFRSLFRGREDVYPRRFESRKTGKAGYAPACANEWVRGICEKPRIKCAECPNRRFLPVTDDVIRWHLSGYDAEGQPFVAGVYPLLQDETCFFLAVDFDKAGWREDATAFLEAARRLHLPAALERSRSGRGAHIWFFFEDAIPAALARRLGSHVLTETMEGRPDIGLDSYDRLFPSQDTMPQGGFGNLIALPLQKGPRQQHNSVFLDDEIVLWGDQWAYLASVHKIRRAHVERIVHEAERHGRILGVRLPPQDDGEDEPWTAPPSRSRKESPVVGELPETLEVVLANQIYIGKEGLHPSLRNRLLRLAAFQEGAARSRSRREEILVCAKGRERVQRLHGALRNRDVPLMARLRPDQRRGRRVPNMNVFPLDRQVVGKLGEHASVMQRILRHLGLPTNVPEPRPHERHPDPLTRSRISREMPPNSTPPGEDIGVPPGGLSARGVDLFCLSS